MAGVLNKTARQFNLKCIGKNGNRVVVRIAPGFNAVNDDHWSAFVRKGHTDPYVKQLKDAGSIGFGTKFDDMEMDIDPDTKSKSKSEPIVKIKLALEKSEVELADQKAINSKHEDEAKVAAIKLVQAELELEQLKKQIAKSDKPVEAKITK